MSTNEPRAAVKNAADPKQVKEASGKVKRQRKDELEDVRYILQTRQGRRFFWRYLERCGVFKTSFDENTHRTFYLEGERNIGLKLLSDVSDANPNAYLLMQDEAEQERLV